MKQKKKDLYREQYGTIRTYREQYGPIPRAMQQKKKDGAGGHLGSGDDHPFSRPWHFDLTQLKLPGPSGTYIERNEAEKEGRGGGAPGQGQPPYLGLCLGS